MARPRRKDSQKDLSMRDAGKASNEYPLREAGAEPLQLLIYINNYN